MPLRKGFVMPLRRRTLVCCLLLLLPASCLLAAGPAQGLELWTYRGELRAADAEGADKQFTLVVLLDSAAESRELHWALDESGTQGWSWVDRIGRVAWDERGRTANQSEPALRYDYGDISGIVPLTLVSSRPEQAWAVGAQWEHEGMQHEVAAEAPEGDQAGWRVAVRNRFGEKRTMDVALPLGIVRQSQERVFLGQGNRYTLTYQVAEKQPLDAAAAQRVRQDFAALVELRDSLQVQPREGERRWSDAQLATLRTALTPLSERIESPGAAQVVRAALEEARAERGRAGALEALRKKALATKLPDFEFEPVGRTQLARPDLDESVTVLHFWDYRDAPLREPYGQSGYLDYLHRKYEQQGVRVVGVVVNQDTERAGDRRKALLSARRFANFMNLNYPLFLDKGSLLEQLGDPRVAEAKLPLFVAVGKDGRIVHYSAGPYEVESNQGLVELEGVIQQALQKAP